MDFSSLFGGGGGSGVGPSSSATSGANFGVGRVVFGPGDNSLPLLGLAAAVVVVVLAILFLSKK